MQNLTGSSMRKTGAWLVRYALEQLPVSHTFGIPGVHNTEIYDELNKSKKITPILVTHEGGGAFMADAVSRTSETIGTMLIVPAAGVTHAISGIAEAYLDGIPMLVLSGGVRTDVKKSFQLHQWDQHGVLKPTTKQTFMVKEHGDIVPTIFKAYDIAREGFPGPVFVEIPANLQLFKGPVGALPGYKPPAEKPQLPAEAFAKAVELIQGSSRPGIFAGWGCRDCTSDLIALAEILEAPCSTTLQGLSVFPADHPLHVGMGFGNHSVPAAREAFKDCDLLIAIGTSFGEIPTGSFGVRVPEKLIHLDINPDVFDKNYPAMAKIEGDAKRTVPALVDKLTQHMAQHMAQHGVKRTANADLRQSIAGHKQRYVEEWRSHRGPGVNPVHFIHALRETLPRDAITAVDDGNHTFLMAELFACYEPKSFICPTDFNCMGYAVPAAIGAKLANPDKTVTAVVGDGAFIMTCMEITTATTLGLGIAFFVFHDGELSQISQGQEIPYNQKTCTVLGQTDLSALAKATGAQYLEINDSATASRAVAEALAITKSGVPVVVDIKIDYSKRTQFTKGVVKTVLQRFPLGDKLRFIGRAFWRKIVH